MVAVTARSLSLTNAERGTACRAPWAARNMEDFVTWVDTSKIRRKILKYNDKLDDYDLLT